MRTAFKKDHRADAFAVIQRIALNVENTRHVIAARFHNITTDALSGG